MKLDFPWTLLLAGAALVLTALVLEGGAGWPLATRELGEPWRLVTGPLVHGTWGHLARDLAVFVLLGAVYERTLGGAAPGFYLVALAVPAAAVLAFDRGVDAYVGLSGAVNAQLVCAFVHEVRGRRPPWWVFAFAAAYAVKLGYEGLTGALLFPMDLGDSVRAAPLAHLAGAVIGLAACFVPRSASRSSARSSFSSSSNSSPSIARTLR